MENCDDEIDREVNRVIDQILREDRLESMGLNQCPDSCDPTTQKITTEDCEVSSCAVETSARFSIRILEALRAVQRKKCSTTRPSCTTEEIVEYIRRHYHHDGDLYSQVETALNQVTGQGFVPSRVAAEVTGNTEQFSFFRFVLRIGANRYHLMGPFAYSVLRPPGNCGNQSSCATPRVESSGCHRRRRKRSSRTPIANSNCRSSGDFQNGSLLDRSDLFAASNVDGPLQQGRNNFEISFVNGPAEGDDFEEDRTISVLEEINPQSRNESVQGPGGNGCCRSAVREHSSDDFMYCNKPVNRGRSRSQNTLRGSRMSESSSSSSIGDTACSRSRKCPSRKRRDVFHCSSDADVSDEDIDEPNSVKPCVRKCRDRNSKRLNRRVHRRCAPSVCD